MRASEGSRSSPRVRLSALLDGMMGMSVCERFTFCCMFSSVGLVRGRGE
jgi:hypothetical protein